MADEVTRCPVCGKKPKIRRESCYERGWLTECCIIECKPFLRKAHKRVEETWISWEGALSAATGAWNRGVNNA